MVGFSIRINYRRSGTISFDVSILGHLQGSNQGSMVGFSIRINTKLGGTISLDVSTLGSGPENQGSKQEMK